MYGKMAKGRGRPRVGRDDKYAKILGDWLSDRYHRAEEKRVEAESLDPVARRRAHEEALELYTATPRDMIKVLREKGLRAESRESAYRRIYLWERAGVLVRKVWEVPPRRFRHPFLFLGRPPGWRPRRRIRRSRGRFSWEPIPARDRPRVRDAKLTAKGIVAPLSGWTMRGKWWIVAPAGRSGKLPAVSDTD